MSPGKVVLVGSGPGDLELITLRGLRRLRRAEVIVHEQRGAGLTAPTRGGTIGPRCQTIHRRCDSCKSARAGDQ